MRCPRDGTDLDAGAYKTIPLRLCPRCHGILVARRTLTPLLESMALSLARDLSPDAVVEKVPDRGGGLPCPRCAGPMENFGYMGSNAVRVDACSRCNLLWADPAELGAMCLLYARTNLRARLRREASDRMAREFQDVVDRTVLSRETEGLLMQYFVLRRLL